MLLHTEAAMHAAVKKEDSIQREHQDGEFMIWLNTLSADFRFGLNNPGLQPFLKLYTNKPNL